MTAPKKSIRKTGKSDNLATESLTTQQKILKDSDRPRGRGLSIGRNARYVLIVKSLKLLVLLNALT